RKIKFNRIQAPGSIAYKIHSYDQDQRVYLDHSFEVTETLITQYQWALVMKENPSEFSDGSTLKIDGEIIQLRPDHPVEKITFEEALEFANRFSIKAGLKPAYDIPKIKEKLKTWKSVSDDDSFLGDEIYSSEGYRLPTIAEFLYLQQQAVSN